MSKERKRSFGEMVSQLDTKSKAKAKQNKKHGYNKETKAGATEHKEASAQALALNSELQALARAKKTKEAIELYNDVVYKGVVDKHHAAIVVNACVRGGDIRSAENIVHKLEGEGPVSVQAYTTLMKGYAHSGDVVKCLNVLRQMCDKKRIRTRNLRPNVRTFNTFLRACLWGNPGSMLDEGWDMYSKALRSCNDNSDVIFDASSYEYYVSAACAALRVPAAAQKLNALEQAAEWESYEKPAQPGHYMTETHSTNTSKSVKKGSSTGLLKSHHQVYIRSEDSLSEYGEAYASGLLAVARAELMLSTQPSIVLDHITSALEVIAQMERLALYQPGDVHGPHSEPTHTTKRVSVNVRGGKRAKAGVNELRMESNRKFRGHKLREIKGGLIQLRDRYTSIGIGGAGVGSVGATITDTSVGKTTAAKDANVGSSEGVSGKENSVWGEDTLPRMYRQFFFFSGAGSTDEATQNTEIRLSEETEMDQKGAKNGSKVSKNGPKGSKSSGKTSGELVYSVEGRVDGDSVKQVLNQLMKAAECFGFGKQRPTAPSEVHEGAKKKKLTKYQLQLQARKNRKRRHANIYHDLLDRSGYIRFTDVFNSASQSDAPLFIELGAGTGDWITEQAHAYPQHNYVSVELRADRVAQTFSAVCLGMGSNRDTYAPLRNVCVVGGECGDVLHKRVRVGTVQGIFVNHPEPPTQSGETNDSTHMLNAENLKACIACLVDAKEHSDIRSAAMSAANEGEMEVAADDGGVGVSAERGCEAGSLVIVSDNIFYTLALARSMVELMRTTDTAFRNKDNMDANTESVYVKETVRGEDGTYIHVYEGTPGKELGYVEGVESRSYFDRLWQTGAGTHASEKVRYLLVVERGQRVPETEVVRSGEYASYSHTGYAYSHTGGYNSAATGASVGAKNKRMRFDDEGDTGTVVPPRTVQGSSDTSGSGHLSVTGGSTAATPAPAAAKNKKNAAKQQRRNERRLQKKRLAGGTETAE
ncbi:hypothetical protein SARC_05345 [Sphaeroforma arctica JP610]|uniref:tRNA (guanine(46)-N(7))-methyltransferase n=1 Tax=Sphaeroforma arctica JP610 TaxID=667725 RepID=A0A0L0G0I7_9EUKA|nr:hypothetical protein SARC_05345 [Sphaeroforma arctica JP610]KNC82374.1 hypothetical protein SARC_05345 [Sphaeroforma arctica JP610]|eukprot:XP_014156276.1 hypothetical protein SARC_05345 [Sphaeroforma arctica JP610]